jgi:hypothetical protein
MPTLPYKCLERSEDMNSISRLVGLKPDAQAKVRQVAIHDLHNNSRPANENQSSRHDAFLRLRVRLQLNGSKLPRSFLPNALTKKLKKTHGHNPTDRRSQSTTVARDSNLTANFVLRGVSRGFSLATCDRVANGLRLNHKSRTKLH